MIFFLCEKKKKLKYKLVWKTVDFNTYQLRASNTLDYGASVYEK